jgi:hypothetical protein
MTAVALVVFILAKNEDANIMVSVVIKPSFASMACLL